MARVTCCLSNQGPDAYQPNVYGDRIIIERMFRADKSSTYKVKTWEGKAAPLAEGQTSARHRQELLRILDHFNIQVENPMIVLSQDSARAFLSSSTSEDKYKVSPPLPPPS